MANLVLKVKVWSKIIITAALLLFALLFIYMNKNQPVTVWLFGDIPTSVLRLLLFTAAFSVVGTILVRTAFRTVRQVRQLHEQSRHEQQLREVAEMHASAAKLQTKSQAGNDLLR